MNLSSPYVMDWNFGNIPEVEKVPPDAVLVVWVPDLWVGLMFPWGDKGNPTRWAGQIVSSMNCIDGKWSIYKNGEVSWEERNVWWAWVNEGTAGRIHDYPTWRQVHGRL